MIASEKKAEILKGRIETMEMMRSFLEKVRVTPKGELRDTLLGAVKMLGAYAQEDRLVIEECDQIGWENYYKVRAKYYGNKQPHPEVHGESGAPVSS